ncbi:aldehyde dehydrogenase family protein [Lacinutrix sp. C3R15]|uniref:aldehyde dehydrogenase family protein n=1 Tax=Flavobacteriaceae TaxID=49546 RepID=UPI001C09F302|nr:MULTISPECIES: aldehyde dehydrogenase family protein [Flavobacteriaceae]MBU2938368.1 aldehyde dehydrogenase family protein [Lacinutrix sp. C3R15]MDO6621683.1 aldehyde dehydrogenase family protein [Oceanihabitans sp. 1_MG-2023]
MKEFKNSYADLFIAQKANQFAIGNTSYKERVAKLNALKEALEFTFKDKIREALYADFKKPFTETDVTEIYPVIGEIKFAKRHLKTWMKRQKVDTPIALMGSSSWYVYEPKGVCLLISPWNFPLNLTFGPLVSAIAAGNTVIIKPSEMTPNISKVMAEIVADLFQENEIALVEGEVEVSQELLKLPFNHIFFTGSPQVGKIVMHAASKHLSSVTLELGGKSPTIIDETANLKAAAKKIAWGKFLNSGQTCIAPDYILIQDTVKKEFIAALKMQLKVFFTADASASHSLSRVVNTKHFNRLVAHLEDAISKNATIEIGGKTASEDNFIEPTVISNVPENASLLQDEIFGPILPIKTYKTIVEAIGYINSKEKPLALYVYSKSKKNTNTIIKNTRAGSTAINNNVLQYTNHNLPFGGTNNSGIGKAHGVFGFQEFSNMRSVLKQHTKGAIEFLFPPYTNLKQKLVDLTIKWF